jgi:Ni/Fe-hydrogenase subunit HybB-like protein
MRFLLIMMTIGLLSLGILIAMATLKIIEIEDNLDKIGNKVFEEDRK